MKGIGLYVADAAAQQVIGVSVLAAGTAAVNVFLARQPKPMPTNTAVTPKTGTVTVLATAGAILISGGDATPTKRPHPSQSRASE